ncbi:MAG: 5-bromo-4-chloroindolyl phosphate hydrolysis protein [Epulopiscium sp.]|nr:5-bromo-4-chloroindolyl phosphate hydrolysis protein [Candidatus Epulonipiscium sp.]
MNSSRNLKSYTRNQEINKLTSPAGQVSSVLLIVFGSIGTIVFGIPVFVLTLLGFTLGSIFNTIAVGLLPLLIISIVLFVTGNKIRKRLQRFNKYIFYMEGKSYCLISDLSDLTGLSQNYIAKDLRKMIDKGMFPQGHIDRKRTWFMLSDECYNQYLQLQKKHIENQAIEAKKVENKEDTVDDEVKKVINDGRKLVSDIKEANVALPGEEITRKLNQLEKITYKIFDHVETHPEKLNEISKFTDYFLPTTLKLVESYKKLEGQPVQGRNITKAKAEIEETMDTINLAFENLLDSLFQDMAMDISTDISVLETMFIQEGLTKANMDVNHGIMEEKNE